MDRLPVVAHQFRSRGQRDEPPKVGDGADAAEVVVAAEFRGLGAMDEPCKGVLLRLGGSLMLEAAKEEPTARTEDGVHDLADVRGVKTPL
jgi:hypothetical protein